MKFDSEKFIRDFQLKPFGQKGFLKSVHFVCPECNRGDKFGIKLPDSKFVVGLTHCFYNCSQNLSLYSFLKKLDKTSYFSNERESLKLEDKLQNKLLLELLESETEKLPTISKPLGFTYIESDRYLEERSFTKEQIKKFHVGISTIDPRYKDYLIFLILQDQELVAFLARSRLSKKWHKENLELSKLGLAKLKLRYCNSSGTDFERILGGEEDIVEDTEILILVEGLMDKANTDRVLELDQEGVIKCCYTFGNNISDHQIYRIIKYSNIKKVILLYDYNSIAQIQQCGLRILNFLECEIGEIIWDTDPGEMNLEEFEYVLSNLIDPIQYDSSRISIKKLN